MSYALPLTNFLTVFRQPTGVALVASVGIHGLFGVGLEYVPILSKQKEISPVQLVELTPEQLGILPEFSQPDMTAMKFDTLVPPSPGAPLSGLPVLPPLSEPLQPWTLPEGSSLYNGESLATIPNLENWPPTPPPINSQPSKKDSSSPLKNNPGLNQTPATQERVAVRSPLEELLSQLPPPPPVAPYNNQSDLFSQVPQQFYTIPALPDAPPELPPAPQFAPQFEGFNPSFPPTQAIPPQGQNQTPPLIDPEELVMNSPNSGNPAQDRNSALPGGVTPRQPVDSAQPLLDTQQPVNPNLAIAPREQTSQNPGQETSSPGENAAVLAYKEKLRQAFRDGQSAATTANAQPEAQKPESAQATPPQQLTHHQQQMLAYHQQLKEQQRLQQQGGSLSAMEEAMLAGSEEFYTWFMQLRQELPDLSAKTPSAIANNYPLAACPQKLEGRAVVGTVVNPDGEMIKSPKLLHSSGSEILDNEALRYVESKDFPVQDQPTAYQYPFEFNYSAETCAIAQPESDTTNQPATPQVVNPEAESPGNSNPAVPSGATTGQGDSQSVETEAFQPQDPGAIAPARSAPPATEKTTENAAPQPPASLTLDTDPRNGNSQEFFAPVPIPTPNN
jgi:TonB family protein